MKIKFLITGLLGLATATVFAQKGELNNAKDKFGQYDVARMNKLTASTAKSDLSDAKTSIDKASTNDKTANLPETFAYKGAIYAALILDTTQQASAQANFKTADDALRKAKSLDSVKQENKKIIDEGFSALEQYKFNEGRTEYQDKKYADAYNSFNYYKQLRPDDTLALYVTALSSSMAGSTDPKYNSIAIDNYKQLVAAPTYNGKPAAYHNLTSIYLTNKDTADAYKTISEAVEKYPADNDLRNRAIIIGLQYGKQDELIGTIETAIKADPKNKQLYYYEGLTYSQIAEAYAKQQSKTKDPVAKSAFDTKISDNFSKAGIEYQKAIDIDPNYADASLNLAYVSIKPLITLYNQANQLPTNQQKLYDADMAKVKAQLDIVQPVMLKAVDTNPNSAVALGNLKTFYLLKNDTADANATQKKIDALPSK